MTNKVEQLRAILAPAIEALPQGVFLWGVEYVPGSRQSLLRIFIDAEGRPVNLDDCASVSREVSALLDVEDPIDGHYNLEVSSPGLDRPLFESAHYQRFVGEVAKVALVLPQAGRRRVQGRIVSVEGDEVVIADEQGEVKVEVGNVQKARLVPQFDDNKPQRQRRGRKAAGETTKSSEE